MGEGDSFYCWTEANLMRKHGIRLLNALTEKFGDELVVFFDWADYFYTRDLWGHVSGERETETVCDSSVSCVREDTFGVWYFPSKFPALNSVEGGWNQPQEWFKRRFIPDLPTLKEYILRVVNTTDEPNCCLLGNFITSKLDRSKSGFTRSM
ncbi:transposase (plasmid) [Haloferacaceae archaeon DSL9]